MESFQYRSLSGNEIRLLQRLPSQGTNYELVYRSLNNPPLYAALSYTWGPPEPQEPINIDGFAFHVRLDLYEALLAFSTIMEGSDLLLWIDAICINQSDLEERSAQVLRMTQIYERSRVVYAWLGESDDLSRLAMSKMALLSNIIEEHSRDGSINLLNYAEIAKLIGGHEGDPPDEETLDGWAAIYMFFRRAWWSRTWIIQEATSKVRTLFFVGKDCVSTLVIENALGVCGVLHLRHGERLWGDIDPGWARRIDHLRIKRKQGTWLPLLDLLDVFRDSLCEKPRDKIYAALPLANDVAKDDFIPDYSKSVEEVFTDLVRFQITKAESGHAFDFLGDIVQLSKPESSDSIASINGLPSWVPDWRLPLLNSQFGKRLETSPGQARLDDRAGSPLSPIHLSIGNELVYHAGTAYQAMVEICERRLLVRGYLLGKITQLSPPNDNLLQTDTSIEDSWLSLSVPSQTYPSGCFIEEALDHTVVADVQLVNGSFYSRGFNRNKRMPDEREEEDALEKHVRLTSMKVATFKRRLAWTDSGYVGLVSEKTEIGDAVCMFFGGQILYILKVLSSGESEDPLYEFRGECYFHGLMDGEISGDNAGISFQEQVFHIV